MRQLVALTAISAFLAIFPVAANATTLDQSAKTSAEQMIPEDLQQMYRDYTAAMLSHDTDRIMGFFSERYLHDGRSKAQRRAWMLEWLNDLKHLQITLTRFTPINEHHAYIEGRGQDNFNGFVIQPNFQVVKEDGQWKLLGDQKRYDR